MTRPSSPSKESPEPSKFPEHVFFNKDLAKLDTTTATPDQALDSTNLPKETICISHVLPRHTKKRVREVDPQTESITCIPPDIERDTKKMRFYNENQAVEVDHDNNGNHGKSIDFTNNKIVHEPKHKEVVRPCLDNFLSFCHLCMKQLHGLDIYIYRGEEAFCSPKCREARMKDDESEKDGHDE